MKRRYLLALAVAALAVLPNAAQAASKPGTQTSVIYNSTTTPLKGNMPSLGFEATSTSEFGDKITFAPNSPRQLSNVVVTLSSWGCVTGTWGAGDCSTPAGSTFNEPITLTVYEPSSLTPVASATQTFAIPYRPSASPKCTGLDAGKWFDSSLKKCFNGLATNVTFNFAGETLPNTVVYGISYNTTNYGAQPIGDLTGCPSGGCGWDSLNVLLSTVPTVGTDAAVDGAYLDSTWSGAYCDSSTVELGEFRLDAGCWTGYTPAVQFKAGGGRVSG